MGGHVDRHRQGPQVLPGGGLPASLFKDPGAQFDDDAGLLGQWDELDRGDEPSGSLSADEGFYARDQPPVERHEGLVVHDELTVA
jgi:hypothetical protein